MSLSIEQLKLEDFIGGWIVGNFSPCVFSSSEIELGVKRFSAGEIEQEHYQLHATEVTLVVEGHCILAGKRLGPGDILVIPPNVSGSFRALTDVTLVVVKSPSIPADKVIGRISKDRG